MQYRALETIRKDGHIINPGELIELTESEATPLLSSQAIEIIVKRFSRRVVVPGTTD